MSTAPHDDRRRRRRVAGWVVAALVLLAGAVATGIAVTDGDDVGPTTTAGPSSPAGADGTTTPEPARTLLGEGSGVAAGLPDGGAAGDAQALTSSVGDAAAGTSAVGPGPVAGAAPDAGDGDADGDGVGSRPHGAGLVLTGAVDEPLRPGIRRTLTVSIRNGHPWPVYLLRTDVRATRPPDHPGCDPDWVTVERYRYTGDGDRVLIGGRSTTQLELDIELVDLPDVNQDACKGASFPFTMSATAAEQLG